MMILSKETFTQGEPMVTKLVRKISQPYISNEQFLAEIKTIYCSKLKNI